MIRGVPALDPKRGPIGAIPQGLSCALLRNPLRMRPGTQHGCGLHPEWALSPALIEPWHGDRSHAGEPDPELIGSGGGT